MGNGWFPGIAVDGGNDRAGELIVPETLLVKCKGKVAALEEELKSK